MSAIISPCGLYRYRLERELSPCRGTLAFIMVNPSTADAEQDDATIRKVRGFAERHSYSRIVVGNLFAFRATDIKALRGLDYRCAVGPDNDEHLRAIMGEATAIVAAWGPMAKLPPLLRDRYHGIITMAQQLGKRLHCLGIAKDGHPRHPLMTPYSMPLTEWNALNV
ncbi:hypothetical protein AA309_19965 [Microvirga vignae]|uniref:DUF1643 domain-containing protein n=1 Tax=Microvirga vignae TaxID=1225564 RepID=A0A0H1R820_9HYPH|nr:DUF1643 domain-containing protein [Microvirga vignae]KLK91380.1 hypothetical protein AA309_19965 [Microvirga vignae]